MFVGSNSIKLNEATMMVAMEEYINKRTCAGVKVKVSGVDHNSTTNVFTVRVNEVKDAANGK